MARARAKPKPKPKRKWGEKPPLPVVVRCDRCPALASFHDNGARFCSVHWSLTPYGQELTLANMERINGHEAS